MSSSEILAIGSTSASQTDSHTAFKDPGSGVSSADDNRKAEVVANEARRHSKVDHLSQARELLENLCKKHVDLTDYSNSAGPSSGGLKSSTDLTKLRDQIWELFSAEKTDIDYLESAAFRNKIRLVEQGCVKHPKKKKFHFKELVDSMVVNPPKSEEQRKLIQINRNRKVAKSSEKLVEKLSEKLTEIIAKINNVEQENGFEEDEEDADVEMECNYVYLDRLKRRAIILYNKIQELECNPTTTMRESQRPITVRCSTCPEVNRAAGKMATRCIRRELTPDFTDVLAIVRRVNEKANLGMSDDRQRSVAQEVFKEIVEEIKRRRIIETRLNMESLEIEFGQQDESDPAENDPELNARLRASEVEGRERIAAVINEFADRQASGADGRNDLPPSSDSVTARSKTPKVAGSDSPKWYYGSGEPNAGRKSLSKGAAKPSSSLQSFDRARQDESEHDEAEENDDLSSEVDESYLNSDEESEDDRDRTGIENFGGAKIAQDEIIVDSDHDKGKEDERELGQMALEDVGHKDDSPTTSNRSGISPAATGCQKEDIEARSASKRSQSGEEKYSNGSARTVSEASKADSKTDERNSSTNSSGASSRADGNRKREKDVNSMKENDSNEGLPQVRELSEVDLKTGSVIETKGPSAAGNEDDVSTGIIFVESVDDDSNPCLKSNGHHSCRIKNDRAAPKSKKRSSQNVFDDDKPPSKKTAVIELSDDSQDEIRGDKPETVVSGNNAASYNISIGRLRALGTNVMPVGELISHNPPEVIEIDDSD
ncbi:uncharacterized protein LOC111262805 isoform X1 [Varroa jacobsoni]|uniref:uncharacterized protein LOC111262805 isoform X1 n=1 Tax=Varroa jacobsoni TaxID=62625 RepID=UPI000BF93BAA|nr:uncharacterized protein LOC111262805 isoform X1 [Varroa jacobsoni]XP_022693106.1 uncharacterized protein LOC111262805 isoform X1 [Varroa jacobsoni]